MPTSPRRSTIATTSAPAPRTNRVSDPAVTERFAIDAARMLSDDKCQDVVVLDVRGLTQVTDFVIIGTGSSDRQMRSVLDHVEELGGKLGYTAFKRSVDERSTWVLVDFVDVIVHMFEPNTRAHYDLEMLWGDAKRPEWERPEKLTRNRAGLKADDALDTR